MLGLGLGFLEMGDHLQEARECKRFGYGLVGTQHLGYGTVIQILASAGDRNDSYVREIPMQHPHHLQAIHVRHEDIGDHQINGLRTDLAQSLNPSRCLPDLIAGSFKRLAEELANRLLIIDDENPRTIRCCRTGATDGHRFSRTLLRRLRAGQKARLIRPCRGMGTGRYWRTSQGDSRRPGLNALGFEEGDQDHGSRSPHRDTRLRGVVFSTVLEAYVGPRVDSYGRIIADRVRIYVCGDYWKGLGWHRRRGRDGGRLGAGEVELEHRAMSWRAAQTMCPPLCVTIPCTMANPIPPSEVCSSRDSARLSAFATLRS